MQSDISTAIADQCRGRTIEELERELSEARDQQAATNAILAAIATSPSDVQPVFECILANGKRLLGAHSAVVVRVIGNELRLAAFTPTSPDADDELQTIYPRSLDANSPIAIAARDRTAFVVSDTERDDRISSSSRELARARGYRSRLIVPMLQRGETIGLISVTRAEAAPFPTKDIALLQTFADQAVIAIENTRLFEAEQASKRQLQESLEYQTAISEVLGIISRSPSQLQPVFDTIVTSCKRLLNAHSALVSLVVGDELTLKAFTPVEPESDKWLQDSYPKKLSGNSTTVGTVRERAPLMISDTETHSGVAEVARQRGFRSLLIVPMTCQGKAIGTINVSRKSPGSFSDKDIDLLKTFADQAVIAIENTRLFEAEQASKRDLQESLEYQSATADVLGVISRSKFELQPILDTITRVASQLCAAEDTVIFLRDGNHALSAAHYGEIPVGRVEPRLPLERSYVSGRSILDGQTIQVPDLTLAGDEFPLGREFAHQQGHRTTLAIPLLREGTAIGCLLLRRKVVQPFTSRQIALVETFADQAVIAIENTRLFEAEQASKREFQESLEYQTATSELLGVISRSPTKLQPVLDSIVKTAAQICRAQLADIAIIEGENMRIRAGFGETGGPTGQVVALDRATVMGRAALDALPVHIVDMHRAGDEFRTGRELAVKYGHRAIVGVPLMREGRAVGALILRRTEAAPFSEQQITLLQTFADQAVIAIENTRLFEEVQARTRELQESLEYQTATSEVLAAISRSPTNVQPVFDTIASSAAKLCNALDAIVLRVDRSMLRLVAHHGYMPTDDVPIHRGTLGGRTVIERRLIHVTDLRAEEVEFPEGSAFARRFGHRTTLSIPLLCEGEAIGNIQIRRAEVRPFSAKQIALVQTFADQAVIAIENSRLFEEVQARTRDLTEALQQQTATADVLKVISRSTFDLGPVLETLVENATRLAVAEAGLLTRFDGEVFRVVAGYGASPEVSEYWRRNVIHPGRGSPIGRAGLERQTVHIVDLLADPEYELREAQRLHGGRSVLGVPMLRQNDLIGVFFLYRTTVRAFTDKQIELVTTFAEQAVIAIENTRLFEEVQARNRDLTALGEVGRAVSSTLDLKVVLKTIVNRAVDLSGTDGGSIFYYREAVGRFELGETTGLDEEVVAKFRKLDISTGETGLGEAITQRQPLQIPDIIKRPSNPLRDSALEAGLRAALIVPLLGGERPLGALVLQRRQPGEFSEAVVSLMQTFADQSAIALENAGLFEEIAQKSRELEIASQHKSQFVANMSHELRTPLAAILGYAELMQEGFYEPQGDKSMAALTRIRSNGKHLLGLINTVLDIAKIESGQFSLNLSEYAIENVVETVRSATESLAETKKLALKTDVAKKLPIGLGDEQRLTQVLLNLVGNAIKFTDTGEVRITAMAMNGHFTVAVTDTGPGIPAEELNRVFEQFHQIDNSNTKAKGGTGLGLAIAKQIVEMHGGRISVESTLGQGATFQMELPVRAAAAKGAA